MAAEYGWELEATKRAYRMAKQVVELMDHEEHHRSVKLENGEVEDDWRSQPNVIALPTEMAAVLADKYDGDPATVAIFAKRLMAALEQNNYSVRLQTSLTFVSIMLTGCSRLKSLPLSEKATCHLKNSKTYLNE